MIGNERSLIQSKEKLSEMVKIYYCFISKGDNFDAKQFNSLQKPNQISEPKCQAEFLTDNKWSLA